MNFAISLAPGEFVIDPKYEYCKKALMKFQHNMHITLAEFRNASRILKQTESLVSQGIAEKITILAFLTQGQDEKEELDSSRSVLRIGNAFGTGILGRFLRLFGFGFRALRFAKKQKAGLVNIHTVAALPVGVFIKWITNARLVYDPHELETETVGKSGLKKVAAKLIERIFIGQADLTIVVGPKIADWYKDKYAVERPAVVMNCPKKRPPRKTNLLREKLAIPQDKQILLYQGMLTARRNIPHLLSTFPKIKQQDYVLVLMGYGDAMGLVKETASQQPNIYFQPAVPPDVVLEYTASADIGLAYVDNPSLNDQYCLPNKLFEFIMAGLPVMVNNAPEMRDLVTNYGLGVVLGSLDEEGILRGLKELKAMDSGTLQKNNEKARSIFNWQEQERIMIDAYRKHFPELTETE